MKTTTFLMALALAGGGTGALADEVKLDGYVVMGADATAANRGGSFYEGKLKVKTKRNEQDIRAVLAAKGKSTKSALTMTDAYFDMKLGKGHGLDVGLMEKRVGLEAEQSHRERITVHASPIHEHLEEQGLIGRTAQIKYTYEPKGDDSGLKVDVSLGHSNSYDLFLTTHVESILLPGWVRGGAWLLGQSDRIDDGYQRVWTAAAAIWSDHPNLRFELEQLGGKDPYESEFQRSFGSGRDVRFASTRVLVGYELALSDRLAVEPYLHGAYTRRDVALPESNELYRQAGLNLHVGDDVRVALSGSVTARNASGASLWRRVDEKRVTLEVSYDL